MYGGGIMNNNNTITAMADKKSILIAEDNASNYKLLEAILSKSYNLLHAWEGKEAVELFAQHRPQIVLMDISMPGMDGYESTREIRKLSATVPIIGLTARAFPDDEQKGYDCGMTEYMTKPINISNLRMRLEQILKA